MQQYRLLRNNKESGPYNWQELRDLPLKAYDLVWAEGKSAAWRYPSEIEELKPYAPAVTEDLYTQFHTPPSTWNRVESSTNSTLQVKKTPQKKYVSVILPRPAEKSVQKPVEKPATISTAFNGLGTLKEDARVIESEQPETKKITTRKQPSRKEPPVTGAQRKSNRFFPAGVALVILLAASLYFFRNSLPFLQNAHLPKENETAKMVIMTGNLPQADPEDPDTRNDIPELKPNPVLDFASLKRYISVEPGDFSVGFFGGISKLELTVTNTGNTYFENIDIAIDFLKKDKSVQHTEVVSIKSLEANSSVTKNITGNKYGIAIRTRITGINGLKAP